MIKTQPSSPSLPHALWRLGRFDKPIGAVLLLFPCWWGVALVQGVHLNFRLLGLFTLGAFVMRAAGCVINDFWDRDIDRQVARTTQRPLASGEVTLLQAFLFAFGLCLIGLYVLLQLPPTCWGLSIVAVLLAVAYPLSKRYLSFPQLILGMTYSMGVPIGIAAATPQWKEPVVFLTYLAAIFWTLAYDTIYALQDVQDDRHLKVGSMAVLLGEKTVQFVAFFYCMLHFLLSIVLYQMESSPVGYGLLGISLIYIGVKLFKLKADSQEDCRRFFVANQYVGALVFLSLMFR
jgi:4-hydroxybenzoate polyprenyl transferase